MNSLSPAANRVLAISILLFLLLLVLLYGIAPLANYYADQVGRVQSLYRQQARFSYLLANEATINQESKRLEEIGSGTDLFLSGNKKSIASANLREFVNKTVENNGGQLLSSQEYNAQPVEATTPVGLRLQVMGEIEHLVNLIYDLESARPIIFIDNISIVSSAGVRNLSLRRIRRNAQLARSSLTINMDIVGYLPEVGN